VVFKFDSRFLVSSVLVLASIFFSNKSDAFELGGGMEAELFDAPESIFPPSRFPPKGPPPKDFPKCDNSRSFWSESLEKKCAAYRNPLDPSETFQIAEVGPWRDFSSLRHWVDEQVNVQAFDHYRYVFLFDSELQDFHPIPNIPSFEENCNDQQRIPAFSWTGYVSQSMRFECKVGYEQAGFSFGVSASLEKSQGFGMVRNYTATGRHAIHTAGIQLVDARGIVYIELYDQKTGTRGYVTKTGSFFQFLNTPFTYPFKARAYNFRSVLKIKSTPVLDRYGREEVCNHSEAEKVAKKSLSLTEAASAN
jgi:hypothetical protein